jgi:hypothetical protein
MPKVFKMKVLNALLQGCCSIPGVSERYDFSIPGDPDLAGQPLLLQSLSQFGAGQEAVGHGFHVDHNDFGGRDFPAYGDDMISIHGNGTAG